MAGEPKIQPQRDPIQVMGSEKKTEVFDRLQAAVGILDQRRRILLRDTPEDRIAFWMMCISQALCEPMREKLAVLSQLKWGYFLHLQRDRSLYVSQDKDSHMPEAWNRMVRFVGSGLDLNLFMELVQDLRPEGG